METLVAFLIGSALTLFFVRRYLKKLTAGKQAAKSGGAPAGSTAPQQPCPRCGKSIAASSSFCSHCGAALAMWSVQRAEVQLSGAEAKGKPKPVINASLCVGCGSCVEVCPEEGTLELVDGKAILSHPERCTGHAKCAQVCPTQAIALAFGGVRQTVKVPRVYEDFQTNVPGIYIVGELGGMGLIKTAINEGKLVIDRVRQRLQQEGAAAPSGDGFDVAIIGAGPAGLSASLTAHQYGLRYLTLEQGEIASTIRQYPRQKFLMAEPVEIPLYGSLYVGDGTKEALLAVWETIVANTGVRIQTNERLERVERNGASFVVESPRGRYHARYVVLALGRRGSPRRLGVPGEDLAKVAYRLIEAETYQEKDLLVVGGGDSALEAALALSRAGTNRVTLCHRGANFQRARERNQQLLEAAAREERIQVLRNSRLTTVLPQAVQLDCAGQPRELPNDYVFGLLGGESPEDCLRKMGIEIVEKAL